MTRILLYTRKRKPVFRTDAQRISRPSYTAVLQCPHRLSTFFNTLQTRLQMDVHGVENVLALVGKIAGIIGDMSSFKNYFIHGGFPDN